MDYEKAYKEALEKAKYWHKEGYGRGCQEVVEDIFHELVESEDEKVRKELLDYCKNKAEKYPNDPKYKNISAWIAWLEKQGEKDRFIKNEIECIKGYREKAIKKLEELEKQGEQKFSYTTLVETGNGGINALVTKELPTNGCDDEQNPAWSEADEEMFEYTINLLNYNLGCRKWLKSLKDRVQPIQYSDTEKQEMFIRSQRPHFWRPSEEHVKALKYVAYHLMPDSNYREEMFSLYEDLKKLTE